MRIHRCIRVIAIAAIMAAAGLALAGCGQETAMLETPAAGTAKGAEASQEHVMHGVVRAVEDGTLLIEPEEGSPELKSSGLFRVPATAMPPSPEPKEGDIAEVRYGGAIREIYPAEFGEVHGIMVIGHAAAAGTEPETYGPAGPAEEPAGTAGPPEPIKAAPAVSLRDARLSSALNDAELLAWSCEKEYISEDRNVQRLIACGEPVLDEMASVRVYHEEGSGSAPFALICPVKPDAVTVGAYMPDDLYGEPAEEYEAGPDDCIRLRPGMAYILSLSWDKDKMDERGFAGRAEYAVRTEAAE